MRAFVRALRELPPRAGHRFGGKGFGFWLRMGFCVAVFWVII